MRTSPSTAIADHFRAENESRDETWDRTVGQCGTVSSCARRESLRRLSAHSDRTACSPLSHLTRRRRISPTAGKVSRRCQRRRHPDHGTRIHSHWLSGGAFREIPASAFPEESISSSVSHHNALTDCKFGSVCITRSCLTSKFVSSVLRARGGKIESDMSHETDR